MPEKLKRRFPLDIELKDDSKSELVELDIPENSQAVGKQIVELNLPAAAMIVMIHRNGKYFTASGNTILEPADHLLFMADSRHTVKQIYESFGMDQDV